MAIVEVVKYNGGPQVFAWKYPSEELGTWTQLIVNESQEAILYKGGQALDIFGPGRHTLDTANIPLLNKIVNLPFGGRSPFTAEVWYVNKAFNLDVKWGTPSPIQLQDPKYGIFAPVRANGSFGIQISDSKKFLTKLVGTMPLFDETSVKKYFRGLYVTKVKDAISSYLVKKKISILEINAYIDELSSYMKERIQPMMDDYGINLAAFFVNEISVPEDDPAVKKLKDALSKRAEMNIVGYSYQQERSFDTLEGAVNNPGSTATPLMNAGLGIGLGVGMGKTMGPAFGDLGQNLNTKTSGATSRECPKCHSMVPDGQRFCGTCGYDLEAPSEEKAEQEDEKKYVCSSCGTEIKKDTKFCTNCGRKINHCSECGADVPDGAKECPRCGHKIPVKCPSCGAEIPEGAKFCPECGFSLVKRCPKCNAVIEGNPKFCPECGEKL